MKNRLARHCRRALPVTGAGLFIASLLLTCRQARAQEIDSLSSWSFHFQQTIVVQEHPPFTAAYSGAHSLSPRAESHTSLTSTLYLGRNLWPGGELYVNPEVAGGSGLSGATGIAGFPNGEIYRVTNPEPSVSLARLFLRQTFSLSDELDTVASDQNQTPGMRASSRVVLTAGKISLMDIFDENSLSHDARTSFLNWALMGNGAWDYPADTKGYTWSIVAEWIHPRWAARATVAMVPTTANGEQLETDVGRACGLAAEVEWKSSAGPSPGVVRLFSYRNVAHMGNYRDALNGASPPDITATRADGRSKSGFGVNWEQWLSPEVGIFGRAGWNDGKNETWAFTEIDRTISVGAVASCVFFGRPTDRMGAAALCNGLSAAHREYLAAGGNGFIIGDGALRYAPEQIAELYYMLSIIGGWSFSADYQFVRNPAYNADRGPVHIFAVRTHLEL